ncbi:MAG: alpha/beta hydrolase [Eubacterium sp.]|nr:alpha/beta hydrolase [Eubacterium sp.]
MKKGIAVVFPGIGYHVDKPLLYYSKKLAAGYGYEIKDVPYGGFKKNIKGNEKKMEEAYRDALKQCRSLLADVDFGKYDRILFLSKSIGTSIAASYAEENGLKTGSVFYTPVHRSFGLMKDPGIVFHGTADQWLDHEVFMNEIAKTSCPFYLIEGGNHSLETGNVETDLVNLQFIMKKTDDFIRSFTA